MNYYCFSITPAICIIVHLFIDPPAGKVLWKQIMTITIRKSRNVEDCSRLYYSFWKCLWTSDCNPPLFYTTMVATTFFCPQHLERLVSIVFHGYPTTNPFWTPFRGRCILLISHSVSHFPSHYGWATESHHRNFLYPLIIGTITPCQPVKLPDIKSTSVLLCCYTDVLHKYAWLK